MLAEYYDRVLYPLQDHVIGLFRDTPFYLTGGTALSRGYYHHRFSDDLDYFVNDHPDFVRLADRQVDRLHRQFPDLSVSLRSAGFIRLFVAPERLKIELINDVPSHIGSLVNHNLLGMLDSRENILANKITALVDRALPKDVVDIFFLLRDGMDIKQALLNADSKAAGISPLAVAHSLAEFDYFLLEKEVKWVKPVSPSEIKDYFLQLSRKVVEGTL